MYSDVFSLQLHLATFIVVMGLDNLVYKLGACIQ
jgi:hypothetical protein